MGLLPELDTRSVLNVVEENFQRVNLKTYAIRMIYIGEHTLSKEDIIPHFKKTITEVNATYCDVPVNGVLLVYDSYFVHILEGSEDSVHRQLRFLLRREQEWIVEMNLRDEKLAQEAAEAAAAAAAEALLNRRPVVIAEPAPPPPEEKPERKMFRRFKMLMIYHSITTRLFDNWRAIPARPPSLVGKLDIHGPITEHMEQLHVCLDKIKKLIVLCRQDDALNFHGLSAVDPKMEALPEVAILDFLLQSQYLHDLREVMHWHRRVDDYVFYFEKVWPIPTHFTPRLLYKLKIDDSFVEPLPVMPWEMKKEKTEDEDQDEERSGSDSSD